MLDFWMSVTMLIEVEGVGFGTGFLIRPTFQGPSQGAKVIKFFVVTNKHVLGDERHKLPIVTLYPRVAPSQQGTRDVLDIPLHDPSGVPVVFEHPDPKVDILLIDVTEQILSNTSIEHDAPSQDVFYLPSTVAPGSLHVEVGTPIAIVGYPGIETGNGPVAQQYNEPIVYHGTVATSPDHSYNEDGKALPGFLINATAIPGHSGSPVILDPRTPLVIDGRQYLGQFVSPYLVGILAQTRFATVKGSNHKVFAGAAFVHGAHTIIETLRSSGLHPQEYQP